MHLIAGGDAGGAKTHLLNLLTRLCREEEVTLVCLGDGILAEEAKARGLTVKILTGGFAACLRAVKDLARGADVLHCHGSRANLTGALAKKALACPVISTLHSDHRLDYLGRPLARCTYGVLNSWALRRMDALVCVSQAMKDRYAHRGFSRQRLYEIYNGVDFDAPLVSVDRQMWFARLGIPVTETDVVIGTAARFDPVKDLPTLLRGFAWAACREPRLKLVLAGSGAEEARLKELAESLNLADRVFFPGWVEDMEGFYASVDLTALSSLWETFPYAITDGARYRKPTVASAVGGIPELVENGVNGFLFAPGDAATLAEELVTMAEDGLRCRLGQALWEKASVQFSLTAAVQRQREIYLTISDGN